MTLAMRSSLQRLASRATSGNSSSRSGKSTSAKAKPPATTPLHPRHLATAQDHHHDRSFYPDPPRLTSRLPSPLATSSRITLDHPLHSPLAFTLPYFDQHEKPTSISRAQLAVEKAAAAEQAEEESRSEPDPPLPLMLTFASDQELIKALYSASDPDPIDGKLSIAWTSTLDPALAYRALRTRHSFTSFLYELTPSLIGEVYTALKPSGNHQRLVTDLLLRHPDLELLSAILELISQRPPKPPPRETSPVERAKSARRETRPVKETRPVDDLRPSLVATIYGLLPPSSRTRLSRRANLGIAKALTAQGEVSLIPPLFHHISRTTTFEPEGVWILLSLISALAKHQAVDDAIPLLHNLVANNRLPSSSLIGKGLGGHPEAKTLIVQTLILRACLEYKFYGRARNLASDLLDTLARSRNSEPAWNLLLDTVRMALVGASKQEMAWVQGVLLKMARLACVPSDLPDSPYTIPSSVLNIYYASHFPDLTLSHQLYLKLRTRASPSIDTRISMSTLMRLATTSTYFPPVLRRLIEDLDKGRVENDQGERWRPVFLRCLVRAGMEKEAVELKMRWMDEQGTGSG